MRVAVAGTFGPLHDGHRALLRSALEHGDGGVVVGVTSDPLARSTRERRVPPFEERRAAVEAALASLDQWDRPVELRRVENEFGFADDDPWLDALVVSPETVDSLVEINDRRRERGFDPLEGIVVPYVLAADGERISSTRVVRGEIDGHGNPR
jgi:pantetheine-phosphate adenylyltransferase